MTADLDSSLPDDIFARKEIVGNIVMVCKMSAMQGFGRGTMLVLW